MDIDKIVLNGVWQLCGRQEKIGRDPEIFRDGAFKITDAAVPGNIELELCRAGWTPDPFVGTNSNAYRKYESWEWFFEKEFEVAETTGEFELEFAGLDCFGTVWVNGVKIGESHNALIPAVFRFSGELLKKGKNILSVHIASPVNAFRKEPLVPMSVNISPFGMEQTRVRKPAHSWGWDIAPRLALGGIIRDVTLTRIPAVRIVDWAMVLCKIENNVAELRFHCKFETESPDFEGLTVFTEGVCGDSRWYNELQPWSCQTASKFALPSPKLWYPRYYGEQNLYDAVIGIKDADGNILDCKKFSYGIRTVRLDIKPTATENPEPDFQFYVNNVPVRAWGLNHVPCDALHSRDRERLPEIMKLAEEVNLNILRIWGGGIPEDDYFYDFCDSKGIMVWHDFMYGCALYPTDEAFLKEAEREAIAILQTRRHHASIVLWAGDNECDIWPFCVQNRFLDPNDNLLNRKLLPDVCRLYTPGTPYMPSSPFISPESLRKGLLCNAPDPAMLAPEQHKWGCHEYFKSDFYKTNASFVSETGYHACANVSALKKFLNPDKLWPWDNEEWYHHASNPFMPNEDYNYRIKIIADQILEFFGMVPECVEDFACASQIVQAEANQYFVECARAKRKMSGMTLWNLIDCWPHFSDAIVDYYYGRKLSYFYCKRHFAPFLIMVGEAAGWHWPVIACNDSAQVRKGHYRVYRFEGETLSEGKFELQPGEIIQLDRIPCSCTEQALLLIEWVFEDGTKGGNHLVTGRPRYDFETFRNKWLPAIAALDGSFEASQTGQ